MSATPSHELFVTIAFETAGVALLAVIADSSKTVGRVLVVLMLSFAFIWLITSGTGMLQTIFKHIPASSPASGGGAVNPLGRNPKP